MRLKNVLQNLGDTEFVTYAEANLNEEILGVKYQNEYTKEIAPDLLYFCSETVFRQLEIGAGQPLSFVVYDCKDTQTAFDRVVGKHNIVLIPEGTPYLPVFNRLVDPFLREQKLAVCIKEMTSALFSNQGAKHLTDVAFSIFKKPIFVCDSSYKHISMAYDRDLFEPDTPLYKYLVSGDTDEPYINDKGIVFLEDMKLNEALAQREKPYRFYHSVFERQAMAIGIVIRNVVVGTILMLECDMPFSEVDEQLFVAFRDLIGQELLKDTLYLNNRNEYNSYFLMDILTNPSRDEETAARRLARVHFVPAEHMNILVIQSRGDEQQADAMDVIAAQLRPALHDYIYAIIENKLVVLLNFQAGRTLEGYLLERIRYMVQSNNLIAGLSNEFRELVHLDRYYRQAKRAALLGQKYGGDFIVIRYDEVADLALLEECGRKNDLMDYVDSAMLRLVEYDEKYGTNYLYTFRVYADNAFSAQQTAAQLYVHKNTLAYRLGKIKEILNTDFSRGREMFRFQLSLRILGMLGMIRDSETSV